MKKTLLTLGGILFSLLAYTQDEAPLAHESLRVPIATSK